MQKMFPLMRAINFRTNFAGYVTRSGMVCLYDKFSLKAIKCKKHNYPITAKGHFVNFNGEEMLSIDNEVCEKCNE